MQDATISAAVVRARPIALTAMALSDHRSIATAMRYFQAGARASVAAEALVQGLTDVATRLDAGA